MKKVWIFFEIVMLFLLGNLQMKGDTGLSFEDRNPEKSPKIASNDGIVFNSPAPPPLPPGKTCDIAKIIKALTDDGNVLLNSIDTTCSLYFVNKQPLSGSAAQAYAKKFGANLVSIQTAAENTALKAALVAQGFGNEVIWIGFGDEITEGDFVWYDGSPVGYTNWAKDEPNDGGKFGTTEDCVQIYADGGWNDLPCDKSNSMSVIEVNLCPQTVIIPSDAKPICAGAKLTLDAKTILGAPDYMYSWVSDPSGFTSTLSNPEVTPTVNTTYTVKVTDRYNCSSQGVIVVQVNSISTNITANGATSFCIGDSVKLTADTGDKYEWNTGATSQSITVKTGGVYSVKITRGVCFGVAEKKITVLPSPVAGFENTTVCNGTAMDFTDKSTGAGVWGWDFGDATAMVTTQNPKHLYAKAGVYTVRLIVGSAGGCVDSVKQKVTVHDTPLASFSTTNNCSKDSIHFKNTSIADPSTNITGYLYDFGDGKTGTRADMGHLYAAGGTYKVTLKVSTADGCTNMATQTITVNNSPVAAASGIQNICASDTAKFTNKSTIAKGTMTYFWDYGDGSPVNSTVSNPIHIYAAGTYTVTLAVVSDIGCTDTLRQPLEVYPAVKADFSASEVCLQEPVVFKNLSSGPVVTYDWNFNDNSNGSDAEPTHTYTIAKTYNVSLSVLSAKNCKSTITKKVIVHELPVAKFTAPNVCDGKNVIFKDLSTVAGASAIKSWIWDFGDGSAFDSITSPQHLYPAVKQYTVKLKISTNFGCIDSMVKQITINPNPVVDFTAADTSGCHPFKTSFSNQSTIASGKIIKWLWEFGSINSKSDLKDPPPYTFKNTSNTDPVKYTIKLTATSDSGCVTSFSKPNYITVFPKPLAAFSLSPREALVTNPIISFKNLSIGADSCEWAFDNLGASDLYNPPPYSFVDTGTYVVSLVASNLHGCSDTTFRSVIIEPDYVLYIPNSFTPNDDDVNDTFGAKGSFIRDYEMTIYDRWGNVMYETKDINMPWNGGIKGSAKLAEEAVYVYIIKIKATNKKNYFYKGAVTVVR